MRSVYKATIYIYIYIYIKILGYMGGGVFYGSVVVGEGMTTVEYLNRFTCLCQPVFVGQSLFPQRQGKKPT